MQGELHPSTSRSGYSVRYNKNMLGRALGPSYSTIIGFCIEQMTGNSKTSLTYTNFLRYRQ